MAYASGQLEDLIADYLTLGSSSTSGAASSNHSLSIDLSSINSEWAGGNGYIKLALATDSTLGGRFTSFTELSGSSYARVNDDANSSGYLKMIEDTSTDGQWKNEYDISFPQSSGSWGTVRWAIFCYDDGSSNFPLMACPIGTVSGGTPAGVSVANLTTLTFSAGDLKFTVA